MSKSAQKETHMSDLQYKLERVPAGHFVLRVYGKALDPTTLREIELCRGVTNITHAAAPAHVIDVSKETVDSDKVAGRVRGRILNVLASYYR